MNYTKLIMWVGFSPWQENMMTIFIIIFVSFILTKSNPISYKKCMDKKFIIKPNGYYEGIVKGLYAGNEGEVLTFLQEMYQANIVYPFEKEQYDFLKKLYSDDIEHTKRLSEILVLMGSDPKLINVQNIWISGKSIDYVKSYK